MAQWVHVSISQHITLRATVGGVLRRVSGGSLWCTWINSNDRKKKNDSFSKNSQSSFNGKMCCLVSFSGVSGLILEYHRPVPFWLTNLHYMSKCLWTPDLMWFFPKLLPRSLKHSCPEDLLSLELSAPLGTPTSHQAFWLDINDRPLVTERTKIYWKAFFEERGLL